MTHSDIITPTTALTMTELLTPAVTSPSSRPRSAEFSAGLLVESPWSPPAGSVVGSITGLTAGLTTGLVAVPLAGILLVSATGRAIGPWPPIVRPVNFDSAVEEISIT